MKIVPFCFFPSLVVVEAVLPPPAKIDAQKGHQDDAHADPLQDDPCDIPSVEWCTSD